MHTPEIHRQVNTGQFKLRVPVLKLVHGIGPVFTGVLYHQIPTGEVKAFDLTKRWLTITEEQAKALVDWITPDNSKKVWVNEKRYVTYPGVLVKLSFDLAKPLGFNFQRRIDGDGQVHNFEIVIADELISYFYFLEKGFKIESSHQFSLENLPSIEEAISSISKYGHLPNPVV